MAKLKDLKEIQKSNKLKGTIGSGFKSGDTDNELMIAEPLQEHPEIKGLYRAFDPETGWRGWIDFTPPPQPAPQPEPKPEDEYIRKINEYRFKKGLVDLELFTEAELNLPTLKAEIKALYNPDWFD